MAGFTRRSKPLKAAVDFDEITSVSITNPADGDLLVYESSTGLWENKKALTGNYTLTGLLTVDDVTIGDALIVGGNSDFAGDLAVDGNLTAGSINVGAVNIASLAVSGNSTLSGTLSVAGSLTGAGFSFSGAGTVTGDLTLGDDLVVTDAATIGGALTVTGVTVLNAALFGEDAVFTGAMSVASLASGGAISGTDIVATGALSAGGELTVYGDVINVLEGLAVYDLSGDYNLLELSAASILEGTGDPNGTVSAYPGSLFLRSDGYADRTLYYKTMGEGNTMGWVAVRDHTTDVEWLFHQWDQLQVRVMALESSLDQLTAQVALL